MDFGPPTGLICKLWPWSDWLSAGCDLFNIRPVKPECLALPSLPQHTTPQHPSKQDPWRGDTSSERDYNPYLRSGVRKKDHLDWRVQQEARAHIMCVHVFFFFLRLSEDSLWHNAALLLTLCLNSGEWGMNEQVTSAWATVSLATSAELHRIFFTAELDRRMQPMERWKEGEEGREQERKEIE